MGNCGCFGSSAAETSQAPTPSQTTAPASTPFVMLPPAVSQEVTGQQGYGTKQQGYGTGTQQQEVESAEKKRKELAAAAEKKNHMEFDIFLSKKEREDKDRNIQEKDQELVAMKAKAKPKTKASSRPNQDEQGDKQLTAWMQEVYTALDTDGDGQVSAAEMKSALQDERLKEVLHRCGVGSEEGALRLFERADSDGNGDGQMSFEEFSRIVVQSMFDAIDLDGSGSIDRAELRKYYANVLRQQCPERNSAQIRRQADRFAKSKTQGAYDESGDGELQFEEFYEMMKQCHVLKPKAQMASA